MRAPWFDFTIGKFTLADLKMRDSIQSISFVEEVGKFDTVKMIIDGASDLTFASEITKLGGVMQLSGGYYNEGIFPMTVVFLHAIEPDFTNRTVALSYMGYLKAMDMNERDRTLSNRTIQEVLEEVLSDYDTLEIGTIESGDIKLPETTTQSKTTDFKLLEGIAKDYGLHWKIDVIPNVVGKWSISLYKMEYDKRLADKELPLHVSPSKEYQSDTKAISLSNFKPKSNVLGVSSRVEIRSNNPNQPNISVNTSDKNPSKDSNISGSEIVATVFGVVTRIHFNDNVSDEEAAEIIAEQLRQEDELKFVVAQDSKCQEGIPNLRLGNVRRIKCNGIPLFEKMFSGIYFITKTKHEWSVSIGYDTSFTANMNSLTVPPPPETGFGGSGIPVLIRTQHGEFQTMLGWYLTQRGDGTLALGGSISQAEIEANSYWMERVSASVSHIAYQRSVLTANIEVGGSTDASHWTNYALPASGYTDTYIDLPESWRTGNCSLATPVTETLPELALEGGISGRGILGFLAPGLENLGTTESEDLFEQRYQEMVDSGALENLARENATGGVE